MQRELLATDPGEHVPILKLWESIAAGRAAVTDAFVSERTVALAITPSAAQRPVRQRCLTFLLHALERGSISSAGIDFNLSASKASTWMCAALKHFGVSASGSKIPLAVAQFAHAVSCPRPHGATVTPHPGSPASHLVHFPRGDLELQRVLPRAEWEAMQLLVEGRSHREIAELRRVSSRTVANQLNAVFRKLRVSGRLDLLRAIACPHARHRPKSHDFPPLRVGLDGHEGTGALGGPLRIGQSEPAKTPTAAAQASH